MSQSLLEAQEVEWGICASCFHGALQPGTPQLRVTHFQRSFILISQVVFITKHKDSMEPALLMPSPMHLRLLSKAIEECIIFMFIFIDIFIIFIYNLIHIPGVLTQWMKKWEYRFPPQLPGTSIGLALSWGWWVFVCLFIIVLPFILLNHFLKIALPTSPQQLALQHPFHDVSLPSSERCFLLWRSTYLLSILYLRDDFRKTPELRHTHCLFFHFNPGY